MSLNGSLRHSWPQSVFYVYGQSYDGKFAATFVDSMDKHLRKFSSNVWSPCLNAIVCVILSMDIFSVYINYYNVINKVSFI